MSKKIQQDYILIHVLMYRLRGFKNLHTVDLGHLRVYSINALREVAVYTYMIFQHITIFIIYSLIYI